jgi:glycosyltransferase involved in cell wall biosynthesis
MNSLSVVIITRNEEHNIVDCIQSAKLVSNNIIVVDAGSDDDTVKLAIGSGAKVFQVEWEGYGASRNFGAQKASFDWILSLDADERISKELADSVHQLDLSDTNCIYRFRRHNYLGSQKIRFGTLGFETVKRIYHRNFASWDLTLVHEKLVSSSPIRKKIGGHINHYGLKDIEDYKARAVLYAQMSAEKYLLQGKKVGLLKRYFSPFFNSVKSFIFQFGFLDGELGFVVAKTTAYYSWLKYLYLHQLLNETKTKEFTFSPKAQVEGIN